MSVERVVKKRAQDACELCGHNEPENLAIYKVPKTPDFIEEQDTAIYVCITCSSQFNIEDRDENHWRCLNDSMWAEANAVKVVAWRMLHLLKDEGWPADLLDMMYMDEETTAWAKDGSDDAVGGIVHKDSNGVTLQVGDSVVLIKDLHVKGSSMIAKRGTAVRNIRLDPDNETYIEGKVGGQTIVIITDYVKKT